MKKIILKIIYKLFKKTPEDVNDDGKVSITDAVKVMDKLMEDNNENNKKTME